MFKNTFSKAFLLLLLLILVAGGSIYIYKKVGTTTPIPQKKIEKTTEQITPTQVVNEGAVSGKLCYPSQFLPAGAVEAMDTQSKKIYSETYIGSNNGGKSTYEITLTAGNYYLRYKATVGNENSIYGYHTDQCPTGNETTCAQDNVRANIKVTVTPGATVENVDLCDFYYGQKTEPKFEEVTETGMANPASVFCEKQGGKLEIVENSKAGQMGLCKLVSGKICEEWALFRGECNFDEDEKLIGQALVQKDHVDLSEMEVKIQKHLGKYASGGVNPKDPIGGGGYFFAVRDNDTWKVLASGNGIISCSSLSEYPAYPAYLIPECVDSKGNLVTR